MAIYKEKICMANCLNFNPIRFKIEKNLAQWELTIRHDNTKDSPVPAANKLANLTSGKMAEVSVSGAFIEIW